MQCKLSVIYIWFWIWQTTSYFKTSPAGPRPFCKMQGIRKHGGSSHCMKHLPIHLKTGLVPCALAPLLKTPMLKTLMFTRAARLHIKNGQLCFNFVHYCALLCTFLHWPDGGTMRRCLSCHCNDPQDCEDAAPNRTQTKRNQIDK